MINCKDFHSALSKREIDFFTGVPDSLLSDFNAYITDNLPKNKHIISANEGGAIALASGYYLSTGKIPLVYMQNSGQGNAVNPLTSLVDKEVYSIPMLLLIGWRGEPNVHDEPQHIKQGRITLKLLETLEIPYEILPQDMVSADSSLERAVSSSLSNNSPYALIVKKGTFEEYKSRNPIKNDYELSREEALKIIVNSLSPKDIVVSTTGKLSRELFEYRKNLNQGHSSDFLTVGSMGHSSQIALGIALNKPQRNVYCLDGDGALIMHMGSMAIIGQTSPNNFKHIIFNNESHESVGGQPTAASFINIPEIATACGYKSVFTARDHKELGEKLMLIKESQNPSLLEIKLTRGARKDLGRPDKTPLENKEDFMHFLKDD